MSLREIVVNDCPSDVCKLCFHPCNPEFGTLYEYTVDPESEVYRAHYFCLLFSSGLDQNGSEKEGIEGFLPADILKEWRRGQRLKCSYCNSNYATVGCGHKTCRKTYHVPCGLQNGCLMQFCDQFVSFCPEHRPRQACPPSLPNAIIDCGVCLEQVKDNEEDKQSLWTPCCGGWFHKKCIHQLAKSTGYFFKCPLCNNKDLFESEMKHFGVFVPEQDASWEMENDAFDSLLERHNTCDAIKCICAKGRDEDVDSTPWEIVLCDICGSRGIHIACGDLQLNSKWTCNECDQISQKLPSKAINVYSPVDAFTGAVKQHSDFLQGQVFICKDNHMELCYGGTKYINVVKLN